MAPTDFSNDGEALRGPLPILRRGFLQEKWLRFEPRSSPGAVLLLSVAMLLLLIAPAQGAARQLLQGHVPAAVSRLQALEPLSSSTHLDLIIGLPLRDPEGLSNLLQQIYDPASRSYHRYLTPEQFAERFGPRQADYQLIIAFAQANGLNVTGTHANRTLIDVNGSVADIEKLFHINLRVYQHPRENRTFHGPDREPSLDVDVPVLSIGGLDNFFLPRRLGRTTAFTPTAPNTTAYATGSGGGNYFIGKDFRAAYASGVLLDGTGESVGLIEFDGYFPNDITIYENAAGLPNVPVKSVLINGVTGRAGINNVEVALDIDMAISVAPGLAKVIIYQGRFPNDILNRMATDNQARQLSSSWGFGAQVDATRQQIFQQFAAQGQSMFQASGDLGAYAGEIAPPSDDPWLIVVGGTSLTTTGPLGDWSSETTWFGSGGGISTNYAIPIWQQGISMSANQGSTTMRNIPDVACLAESTVWLVANNGQQGHIGGTSASAPLWAGFAALVNQQAAANGQPSAGFMNPALYTIGKGLNYESSFHDITTGNNTNSESTNKFFAVPGYDLCTGWGTPTGSNLIFGLLGPPDALRITPAKDFAASGPVGGPFNPPAPNYSLANFGVDSLDWTLVNTSVWLNVSPSSGTIGPGEPAATVLLSVNSGASSLSPGIYTATIWFTNLNAHSGQERSATLTVVADPAPGITMITLHSFSGGADGGNPNALVQSTDGNLFGTTQNGGTNSLGTIFRLGAGGAPVSLYSFTGPEDGAKPFARLAQGTDGDFYGVTYAGGTNGYGTVFRTTADGGLTNLRSLAYADGILPYGTLVQTKDGNFYGTAYQGGPSNYGAVFAITSDGAFRVLYSFTNAPPSGYLAYAGLVQGVDANLYGTTYRGGAYGVGTVFKMTTNGALTSLASFNNTNGAFPFAGLAQGSDGNLYGATFGGGSSSNGAIFRISPTGVLTNLYSFGGGSNGRGPAATLLEGSDGNFYGTTAYGGIYSAGTLFRFEPNGTLATLLQFNGLNGANPLATLVQGSDGDFYGTTQNGGASGHGVLFRFHFNGGPPQITRQPGDQSVFQGANATFSVTVLGSFPLIYQWRKNGMDLTDGDNIAGSSTHVLSVSNATMADAGTYSVLVSNGLGSVPSDDAHLEVVSSPPQFTKQPTNQTVSPGTTVTFNVMAVGDLPLTYRWQKNGANLSDGGNISGSGTSTLILTSVTEAHNGTYTAIASNALNSVGSSGAELTVIPVSAPGTRVTTLHWFNGGSNGRVPNGLMQGTDGDLYGTTQYGGEHLAGTVFKMTTNGVFTTLVSFTETNGLMPVAAPVQGADHNLYGTTQSGGAIGLGTVFRMTPGGMLSTFYSFTGDGDGGRPNAGLVQGADGNFYGASSGISSFNGHIFKISPEGSLTNAYSFTGGADGSSAVGALVQGSDGNFFGMSASGGASGFGDVFKMSPDGTLVPVYAFTGGMDGYAPVGALVQGTDGNFYGVTKNNVIHGFQFYGTIFKLTTNGMLTTLYALNYTDGSRPHAGLVQASDGNFYGTTYDGGAYGNGTLFRIAPNGAFATLVSFDGFDDGARPEAALIQGADASLYGTTTSGGPLAQGTIFRVQITSPPQITTQPANKTVLAGASVSFSVAVFGAPPLFYQWRRAETNLADGGGISGSSGRILTLKGVGVGDAGSYSVIVSNNLNFVTSAGAALTVLAAPVFQTVGQTNGTLTLTWSAVPGQKYQLQSNADLNPPNWTNFGSVITATIGTVTVSNPVTSDSQRFYRAVLLP